MCYGHQRELLFTLLAKILRRNRMNEGAISFDKVEVKFNLDHEGEPEGVYFKIAKM